MPTFRERIAGLLIGDKLDRVNKLTENLVEAYAQRPYMYDKSPEQLIKQLAEVDSRYIDLLVRQIRDAEIAPLGNEETLRLTAVNESRSLFKWDVVTQSIIDMWRNYAFDTAPQITPTDETALDTWNAFWKSRTNQYVLGERSIHELSDSVLTDGELFFVFFVSTLDGECTVRVIPTEQITGIICHPNDNRIPIYYKRTYAGATDSNVPMESYYLDWRASLADIEAARKALPADAIYAEDKNHNTRVVILHAAHRKKGGRGWPLMTAGAPWSRAYRNFLQDRAAVARAAASVVEKVSVKGSSRAVDAIRSRLESSLATGSGSGRETNPPPTAGSIWVENEAASREWMNRPSGGTDADKDGAPLLTQAGLAGGIYPHYLGRGESFRLATSTSMETPMLRNFGGYQRFWASVWGDMVAIVLGAAQLFGGKTFTSLEAKIDQDTVLDLDVNQVKGVLDSLSSWRGDGFLDNETGHAVTVALLKIALQSFGVEEVDEIFKDSEAPPEAPPAQGETGHPKTLPAVLTELYKSADTYKRAINQSVYGFWSGKIHYGDFYQQMADTITTGLQGAWYAALEEIGATPEDMSDAEITTMYEKIAAEQGHVPDFAGYILAHNKASGAKLADLEFRVKMWVNRWNDVKNLALTMAQQDPPLTWVLGQTKEHCRSCAYYNGKTKRGSYWRKIGAQPQSEKLACKGYNCFCQLLALGNKLSKGNLKRPESFQSGR